MQADALKGVVGLRGILASDHSRCVQELADALNVGPRCSGFTLNVHPHSAVVLTITRILSEEEVAHTTEVIKRYQFIEENK